MFSHVFVGVKDVGASRKFYDAIFGALGIPPGIVDDDRRISYRTPTGIFGATIPINGEPATFANGGTIGFSADSPEQVEAWHAAGVAAGGTSCEDPPGIRELPFAKVYLAYLRDPAGNKLCAIHRMG